MKMRVEGERDKLRVQREIGKTEEATGWRNWKKEL